MKHKIKDYKTWTPKQKEKWLKIAKQHRSADRFIQGSWLKEGKDEKDMHRGCFLGCMMQSENNVLPTAYKEMRLPAWIVYVAEKIFEGLPKEEAKEFPVQLLEAIPTGVDTYDMWNKWHYIILMDEEHGQYKYCGNNEECKEAVKMCADLFTRDFTEDEARSVASAASAAWVAGSASGAESAAWSARSAMWSAWSVASAESAESARSAVWGAGNAAWGAGSAERSALRKHYQWMRDKLIEILSDSDNDWTPRNVMKYE